MKKYARTMDVEEQSKRDTNRSSLYVKNNQFSLQQFTSPHIRVDLNAFWKKPTFYSEGSGVKLKYIPAVAVNFEAVSDSFIGLMHRLLYLHVDEKPNMYRNVLEFSGLKCDVGTVNFICRMKILSVLSVEQLILICHVLCLPLWDYSRQILADTIMNFLLAPQMIDLKGKVPQISNDEFILSFDCSKIDEIISQERKAAKTEEIKNFPDVHLSNETTSKETVLSFENKTNKGEIIKLRLSKTKEMEVIPDIPVTEQSVVVSPSGQQIMMPTDNSFSKTMNIPHVLQACQNYDFRYQRELLKSGVTLNLNPEDYLDQAIGNEDGAFRLACAKYMKNYHITHQQQSRETEEQAATRRAQNALRMRNYRQSLRVLETEEQAAERRAQNALRMRNYRRFKRELEPELAAERRAQNAERMRNYRKVKRELEPETAALRRAKNALRMRNYRKNKRQEEPA